jgi:hypothetical protein
MTWNYRVIDTTEKEGEPCFIVAEVFYNDDGIPWGYSDTGIDGENIEEIKQTLKAMKKALKDEVLQASFFENLETEYEPEVGNEL